MAARYDYRLGWRSLKIVADLGRPRGDKMSVAEAKELAHELGRAMHDFRINTRLRAIHFIAQVAHESGGFRWRTELASGGEYEGRRDLGNVHPGDGRRYKGRSFIQVTGRTNYEQVSRALGVDFVRHPEKLGERKWAARAAAWWWTTHGLNELADRNDVLAVTKRINGGTNGLDSRKAYLRRARAVSRFLVPKRRKPQ